MVIDRLRCRCPVWENLQHVLRAEMDAISKIDAHRHDYIVAEDAGWPCQLAGESSYGKLPVFGLLCDEVQTLGWEECVALVAQAQWAFLGGDGDQAPEPTTMRDVGRRASMPNVVPTYGAPALRNHPAVPWLRSQPLSVQ